MAHQDSVRRNPSTAAPERYMASTGTWSTCAEIAVGNGVAYQQATAPNASSLPAAAVGNLWSDTTAALLKRCTSTGPYTWVSIEGGAGGAPTDATYVTLTTNATLTAERTLAAGNGMQLSDAGANNAVTLTPLKTRAFLLMGG